MTLDELKSECNKILGIAKTRKARLGDGVFLTYKPLPLRNGLMHIFTDFIALDSWEYNLERTKKEYERLFLKRS